MAIDTFKDFVSKNPKYKKYKDSDGAEEIYDYLKKAESIDKMILANENGKPALYGVQAYLETNYAELEDFNFKEGFVKQCVGSMVRDILAPFGYYPNLQRDLPKKESLYFTSAMNYSFDQEKATCKLVKKLEIITL